MREVVENDLEFSTEMFEETFKLLQKKGGSKFDFILKAGKSLHSALKKLYEVVWKQEGYSSHPTLEGIRYEIRPQ